MSKFQFALQWSLVLVLASHGLVNAQTATAPRRDDQARTNQLPGMPIETNVERYKERVSRPEPSSEGAKRFYKLGIKYGQRKLYRQAVAAFELAIRLHPHYADAYFGLGNAHSDMGRLKEGIDAFRRVIQLNPKDDEAYARLQEINARLASEEKTILSSKRAVVQNYSPAAERVGLDRRVQSNAVKNSNPKSTSTISGSAKRGSDSPSNQPAYKFPSEPKGTGPRVPPPSSRNVSSTISSRPMSNAKVNSGSTTTSVQNTGSDRGTTPNPVKNPVANEAKKNLEPARLTTANNSRTDAAAATATPATKTAPETRTSSVSSTPITGSSRILTGSTTSKATSKDKPQSGTNATSVPVPTPTLKPVSNSGSHTGASPTSVKNSVPNAENKKNGTALATTSTTTRLELTAATAPPAPKGPPPKTTPSTPMPIPGPNAPGNASSKQVVKARAELGTNITSSAAPNPVSKTESHPVTIPNTVKNAVPNVTVNKNHQTALSTASTNSSPELAPATPASTQPDIAVSKTAPETGSEMTRVAPVPTSGRTSIAADVPNFPASTDSAVVTSTDSSFPDTTKSSEEAIYHLGVGDVLDVRVSDLQQNNSTLFTVSASGFLDYPVLNEPMKVAGLTTDEVEEKLRNELKRLALSEDGKVSVAVRDYKSHTILVTGLVNRQGPKVLRREAIPLYVVLAEAQPLPQAGRVSVISHDGATTTNVNLATPETTALLIRPGDVVVVQATPKLFFYIGGDVKKPGEWSFREGLKLTQAILLAGGATRASKAVELARENTEGLLEVSIYKLSDISSGKIPDPLIRPGDRITILR